MSAAATLRPPAQRTRNSDRITRWPSRVPRTRPPRADQPIRPAASLDAMSDEALLSRFRDESRGADFAELHRRYSSELHRYLTRYLGSTSLAEDVLQDTFLRVHSKCRLYRDGCPARSWIYTIAVHRAIDTLRKSSRVHHVCLEDAPAAAEATLLVDLLADGEPGPLECLLAYERRCWVREKLTRLPEPLRQVLMLAYFQGLSYDEIVSVLHIPVGTVKSRLHRAVEHLRKMAGRPAEL